MYDLSMTLAKLDLDANSIDFLRGEYPELGFVFDRLEEAEAAKEEMEEDKYEEVRDMERERDCAEERIAEGRDRVERLVDEVEDGLDDSRSDCPARLRAELEATRDDLRSIKEWLE